jgi:hypothetical protein
MTTWFEYLDRYMPVFWLIAFVIIATRAFIGVKSLRARGLSIRPQLPADALFGESGASGHSEATLLTRHAGASRCLLVSITRKELVVESMFPFNVVMYQNPFDLEHRVPIGSIGNAWQVDAKSIRVSFVDPGQKSHTLRLYLKQPAKFLATLNSLHVRSIAPLEGSGR